MKKIFRLLIITVITLNLVACGNREDKAQNQFEEIHKQEQTSSLENSEKQYQQLITEYPGTKGALKAEEQVEYLLQRRTIEQKQHAYDAIKSIPRVVFGFKSFNHCWPKSVADFDNNDFFFDSNYMADSVPTGYTAYLALTNEKPGYKVWSLSEQTDQSYRLHNNGKKVIETQKTQMMAEIEANYQIETQKGSLIFMVPKTVIQ